MSRTSDMSIDFSQFSDAPLFSFPANGLGFCRLTYKSFSFNADTVKSAMRIYRRVAKWRSRCEPLQESWAVLRGSAEAELQMKTGAYCRRRCASGPVQHDVGSGQVHYKRPFFGGNGRVQLNLHAAHITRENALMRRSKRLP